MFRDQLGSGIFHVGQALRDPEVFAVRWNQGDANYRWWVWLSLAATAILGTTTYGMTMGLLGKPGLIFYKGGVCTLAAGLAWSLPLPALYILNSLSGSRLSASSTQLAALVTTSWGGREAATSDRGDAVLFGRGQTTAIRDRLGGGGGCVSEIRPGRIGRACIAIGDGRVLFADVCATAA